MFSIFSPVTCYVFKIHCKYKLIVRVDEITSSASPFLHCLLNLNLNSLLVKRQIDNPSKGVVTGGN